MKWGRWEGWGGDLAGIRASLPPPTTKGLSVPWGGSTGLDKGGGMGLDPTFSLGSKDRMTG